MVEPAVMVRICRHQRQFRERRAFVEVAPQFPSLAPLRPFGVERSAIGSANSRQESGGGYEQGVEGDFLVELPVPQQRLGPAVAVSAAGERISIVAEAEQARRFAFGRDARHLLVRVERKTLLL